MRVLGLDPGTQNTGFCVVEVLAGRDLRILEMGSWNLLALVADSGNAASVRPSLGSRLEILHGLTTELLGKWNPSLIGLEKAVSFKNVSSAMKLSEARGVIRQCVYSSLDQADRRLVELSPTAVKRAASGLGLASKGDVARVLALRFPELTRTLDARGHELSADAVDALAVAWCAWISRPRIGSFAISESAV